jgi:hypothetical protein
LARLFGGTGVCGCASGVQSTLASRQFTLGQVEVVRSRSCGARGGSLGAGCRRSGDGRSWTTNLYGRTFAFATALGLHHHGLGTPMAEALPDNAGIHGSATGLQGQGRTPTGPRTVRSSIILAALAAFIVVRVAHPLALLTAGLRKGGCSPIVPLKPRRSLSRDGWLRQ